VSVRGLRLHFLDYGGGGDPVVCLHGVTGHAWMWHGVTSALGDQHRVVALDLRGHGDSQWSAEAAYETDEHVADLGGVLDSIGLESVHLVGLSWGGLVALRLAASFAASVRSLVVIDAPLAFEQEASDVPERPYAFDDHASVEAWERQSNPHAPAAMIGVMAAFGVRPGDRGSLVRKYDRFFTHTWPFRRNDHTDDWREVRVATLLVRASASHVLSEDAAQAMRRERPDVTFEQLQECGHLVPVERPVELADVLRRFWVLTES
jgi:pimeloyl-ACP methyl ester carboxylesterase